MYFKKSYDEIIKEKINQLKPELIYCNFQDLKIEKLLSNLKNSKKLFGCQLKLIKKILQLKNSYDFIISGNQNILKLAKLNKFKSLELMISSPSYKIFTKKIF